jgi:hypothetical protein
LNVPKTGFPWSIPPDLARLTPSDRYPELDNNNSSPCLGTFDPNSPKFPDKFPRRGGTLCSPTRPMILTLCSPSSGDLAARGAGAAGRPRSAHRRAHGARRKRSRDEDCRLCVHSCACGLGLDRWPQRAEGMRLLPVTAFRQGSKLDADLHRKSRRDLRKRAYKRSRRVSIKQDIERPTILGDRLIYSDQLGKIAPRTGAADTGAKTPSPRWICTPLNIMSAVATQELPVAVRKQRSISFTALSMR